MRKLFILLLAAFLILPLYSTKVLAADTITDLTKGNQLIQNSIDAVKSGDLTKGKEMYEKYKVVWLQLEDGVKAKSKEAYRGIEDKMGMVLFFFTQSPIQKDKLQIALIDLLKTNNEYINNGFKAEDLKVKGSSHTIKDLIGFLENAKTQIKNGDLGAATKSIDAFNSSWIDVEGVVLTQSKTVYDDAERDMVSIKAYITVSPINESKALKVIDRMLGYLSLLSGDTSYGIVDVITIILREGLEALLVVVALLGFLKKSGQERKRSWIYGGVGVGFAISIVLAILVKVLFTSGTFGNNNFLISGWTGVFAAVMLIYVSYWLHSKSKISSRKNQIEDRTTSSLASGSMFSLGFLAFLAVFREGTETVLFYIGMASSISLMNLFIGIALGFGILILIAILMLKVGLRIPMKPFFLVSSLLVFYLGFKFTGMGINGLQLAGLLPATTSDVLPTISSIAVYPTWEGFLPQALLVILAIIVPLSTKLTQSNHMNFKK